MSSSVTTRSGVRGRTRRAILRTAASVLARNYSATLADIADAAEVGRTTLHRYFPDRESLVNAVIADSFQAMGESVADAAVDQGPPLEAMRRLVAAMVELGDRLLFLFGDPRVLAEWEAKGSPGYECPPESAWAQSADPSIELIKRGQAEGVFDPGVSAEWIQHVLWALVYTGCEDANNGRLPRHGVTATVIRTLEHGICAAPPPPADPRV